MKTFANGSHGALQGLKDTDLNDILAAYPLPAFMIDRDCRIIHWNRACELLTRIDANQMIGTTRHRDIFYDRHRKVLADLVVETHANADLPMFYDTRYRHSQYVKDGFEGEAFFPRLGENGRWLFFTASRLKDRRGSVVGAMEVIQDVTALRTAERALKGCEPCCSHLFDNCQDAVFIVKDHRIVRCNENAIDLFGYARREIVGSQPLAFSPELQPDGSSSKEALSQKIAQATGGAAVRFAWQFLRKNGACIDTHVVLTRYWVEDACQAIISIRGSDCSAGRVPDLKTGKGEAGRQSRQPSGIVAAPETAGDRHDAVRRMTEERFLLHLRRFVFPHLNRLTQCSLDRQANDYLDIVRTNLNDIVAGVSSGLFLKYIDFTPTEIHVADLIREGRNTKDIAEALGLATNSVKWHRKNIRNKLGLRNTGVNLYNYLNALTK